MLVLEPPETDSHLAIVDVRAVDAAAAVTAAWSAYRPDFKRPVKLVLSYAEELLSAARRHPTAITLKTGVKNDGTLMAVDAKTVFGGGAYGAFKMSPQVVVLGARQAGSVYRIPAIRVENFAVYTNHPPGTQTRSPGAPQITSARGLFRSAVARATSSPVESRMKLIGTPVFAV